MMLSYRAAPAAKARRLRTRQRLDAPTVLALTREPIGGLLRLSDAEAAGLEFNAIVATRHDARMAF
jgi:chorismate-pyruvate lyase